MEDEKDERPLVKDLLEQYASKIAELRVIIEKDDSYSKEHYDDIWMLRFLLSHKKVSKASRAALHTMKFRQERKMNELGDIRHKMTDCMDLQSHRQFDIHRKFNTFFKANTAFMVTQPDGDRGLVNIICLKDLDMQGLVENMSRDEVLESYLLFNEIVYQILDEVTRRTGKLTKLFRISDLTDFPLRSVNAKYVKRDAAANKEMEDLYPQMLGTIVYVNAPGWANALWRVFKPFFPKRFLEKLAFVNPLKYPNDVKYFLKYISKDNLVERYGGNNSNWPVPSPSHLWKK